MHTKTLRLLLALLLIAFAAAPVACGDDDGKNETDTTTDTAGADGDSDTTATDTTGADTAGVDTTGQDTAQDTAGGYEAGLTTYLSALQIPAVDETTGPTCCYDWGGQSRDKIADGTDLMDNALAQLNALLVGFDMDLTPVMNERLADGTLVVLFDHHGLDGATDANGFDLAALLGEMAGATTATEAAAGDGTFNVFASSLDAGDQPLVKFAGASMNGGAMSAGPADFHIQTQLTNMYLDANISQARLTGSATVAANGVSYVNGTLAGYITVADLARLVNDYLLSDTCACLGINGPVYVVESDGSITGNCVTDAHTLCTTADNSVCATMADKTEGGTPVCTILPGIMANLADIDLDGNCAINMPGCSYEGLSIGLQWTGVTGSIVGISE